MNKKDLSHQKTKDSFYGVWQTIDNTNWLPYKEKTYSSSWYLVDNSLDFSTWSSSAIEFVTPSSNTTDSKSLNELNNIFYRKLESSKNKFIDLIHHSDFEDGCENEVIRYIQEKVDENASVTINWLASVYNELKRVDESVVIAILRSFAYIKDNKNFMYIEAVCNLIIENCLRSASVGIQEAALMVIESLRTKKMYSIMSQIDFSESILLSYEETIKSELKEELEA